MNLLALDLSLTSTGWAANDGNARSKSGTVSFPGRGVARLAAATEWVDSMLSGWEPRLVVIEGYAFGRPQQASHIGELGGVVRLHLYRQRVPFVELPPACRAKLATGKGNAGKEQVLVEAVRRLGYQGHSNDEADALWLLQAALITYRQGGAVQLPQAHLDALKKIEWPAAPLARAS